MSSGREEKAREVGAVDARPAPVAGDRGEDVVAVAEERVVAALHLARVDAAPAQEERDLLARRVTREQLVVLRRALHEDRARDHAITPRRGSTRCQQRADEVRRDREVLDVAELAGELLQRERVEDVRPASPSGSRPARARRAAAPASTRSIVSAWRWASRRRRSSSASASTLRAAASSSARRRSLAPVLGDELLLAARELDAVGELVLGDRALVLDRGRAAGERRLVGAALDLPRAWAAAAPSRPRSSARPRRRGRRRAAGRAPGQRRLLGQAAGDPGADRRDALGEDRAQLARRELVDDELLRELGQQAADLLERLAASSGRTRGRR